MTVTEIISHTTSIYLGLLSVLALSKLDHDDVRQAGKKGARLTAYIACAVFYVLVNMGHAAAQDNDLKPTIEIMWRTLHTLFFMSAILDVQSILITEHCKRYQLVIYKIRIPLPIWYSSQNNLHNVK